jgi:hypothetical protein
LPTRQRVRLFEFYFAHFRTLLESISHLQIGCDYKNRTGL